MMISIFQRNRRETLTTSPAVAASPHADGVIFLHAGTGSVFAANETGAAIWEALRRGEAPESLGATLAARFGISEEVARRDAAVFVASLEAEGILVRGRAA